jgi:3-isopropylmalate/(R)-2-methylmalate dehydratase small subunit
MTINAKAFKFGDDINTDYIISGKYKFKSNDMNEMAHHAMEELDPNYYEKVSPNGGVLVAGTNFGMGSSREQAPLVLIHSNTHAVLAKSFARIFYRNAINRGLPLVECDTDKIADGDELELDLTAGVVKNKSQGIDIEFSPLPEVMAKLLDDGGLAAHFKKHNGFNL